MTSPDSNEFAIHMQEQLAAGADELLCAVGPGTGPRVESEIDVFGVAGVSEKTFAQFAQSKGKAALQLSGLLPPDIDLT